MLDAFHEAVHVLDADGTPRSVWRIPDLGQDVSPSRLDVGADGALRCTAEYFREPDSFLGPLALGLSMGQWLCVPMVLAGMAIMVWSVRRGQKKAP